MWGSTGPLGRRVHLRFLSCGCFFILEDLHKDRIKGLIVICLKVLIPDISDSLVVEIEILVGEVVDQALDGQQDVEDGQNQ